MENNNNFKIFNQSSNNQNNNGSGSSPIRSNVQERNNLSQSQNETNSNNYFNQNQPNPNNFSNRDSIQQIQTQNNPVYIVRGQTHQVQSSYNINNNTNTISSQSQGGVIPPFQSNSFQTNSNLNTLNNFNHQGQNNSNSMLYQGSIVNLTGQVSSQQNNGNSNSASNSNNNMNLLNVILNSSSNTNLAISSNNQPIEENTVQVPLENVAYINQQNSHNTQKSNTSDQSLSKYSNGVDFDRICGYNPFMKEIFARVTCSICTLIPFDPLECKNCNAVVCKPCIEMWKRKECILKCGGENYDHPSRILRDIINSIVIKCKNAHKGCNVQLRIDYMRTHEAECDFDEIKCPFPDCQVVDLRKNINIHIDVCEFNKIKCKFCKGLFKKSDFNSHIELDCEEVLIECEKCQKSEKRKDFGEHNCILALKEENKDLQATISNLMNSLDGVKLQNEDISKQLEEERRVFNEKKTLMNLMINLLKSNYEIEEMKNKSYNTYNPIQIPYIFRFMTSSRTLQITNLADYTFTKISLIINFEIPTSHQSIVTSSKKIFIVGGVNHEKKTYEFDVLNKTLIEHAEMNVGRRRHILTELRPGIFIATGGSNQNEEVLRDCEAYIVAKNTWIKISSLNVPRFYHTAFSYKGSYMYVVGGCHTSNSSLVNLNTIERIDLSHELNGSWDILNVRELSLLKPRSRLSYLFISSDKILLFGGIPDYQAVFYDMTRQEISLADNQFNIEGRFFFNDRCTWQNETLFISSQSSRCIFNHSLNCWELKEFTEENN